MDERTDVERRLALAQAGELGLALIRHERLRQVEDEGRTPEHDDGHDHRELLAAAVCIAREAYYYPAKSRRHPPNDWPWEPTAWKPTGDAVRDLTKAGALIAAEIDRLQRLPERSSE